MTRLPHSAENSDRPDSSHRVQVGIITKIEPVKHRRERWSIFLNDQFALAVSGDTLTHFHLAVGQPLTARQLDIIEQHETYEAAKNAAVRYLGVRMRSERELSDYLRRKQIAPSVIVRVINYCREHHYLDDLQFAQTFVRDKINLSKDGSLKIKAALIRKGVSAEIINQVWATLDTSKQQLERAIELSRKKWQTLKTDPQARDKILRYLQQKGYPLPVALEALRAIQRR